MCGIAGIIGSTKSNVNISKMLSRIKHRGEDAYSEETVVFEEFAIGTNRLAIVDEENGKQPFSFKGEIFCVLNGEIYNHGTLKEKLKDIFEFKSNCDTEVVMASYITWGKEFIKFLDGKFAICIIDTKSNSFLLARDHIGIKPLYYAYSDTALFFASELKAFCDIEEVDEIHEFPYAHIMVNKELQRYVSSYVSVDISNESLNSRLKKVETLITDAVRKRIEPMRSRVACLLSGGIDSSIIVYLAQILGAEVEAFTISHKGHSNDLDAAKKLCSDLNIKHTIFTPEEHFLQELYLNFGVYITESYEKVLVRNAVVYYALCKEVRKRGYKYLLNGEGADELFAGYEYFKQLHNGQLDSAITASLLDLSRTYLKMADRASMYATVEARMPYLDQDVVKYSRTIPTELKISKSVEKWILRESFKDKLPLYITERPKVGMNEGAGFGKNTEQNLYYNAVIDLYQQNKNLETKDKDLTSLYAKDYCIDLSDKEEIYNFCRYSDCGFLRLSDSNVRLQLNTKWRDYDSKNCE
jgi:asparagine synthase (glutamine-hydrolysing)